MTITAHRPVASAHLRLLPGEPLRVEQNSVRCEVPAGGVRIVELR